MTKSLVNEEETSNSIIETVDHTMLQEDAAVGLHTKHQRWNTPLFANESAVTT